MWTFKSMRSRSKNREKVQRRDEGLDHGHWADGTAWAEPQSTHWGNLRTQEAPPEMLEEQQEGDFCSEGHRDAVGRKKKKKYCVKPPQKTRQLKREVMGTTNSRLAVGGREIKMIWYLKSTFRGQRGKSYWWKVGQGSSLTSLFYFSNL